MNTREKKGLQRVRKLRKKAEITEAKRARVADKIEREEERARDKARADRIRERRKKILREYIRELEEKKQRFLAGGVFFTFPGAALLYEDEEEARKSGGDAVRRFDNTADAVRYAKTGE